MHAHVNEPAAQLETSQTSFTSVKELLSRTEWEDEAHPPAPPPPRAAGQILFPTKV